MAAMTWNDLQTTVIAAMVQAPSPYTDVPADFTTLFPQATSYAEGRIYKEVVFLATRRQATGVMTPGFRSLALSTIAPPFPMVVEGFALIVPTSAGTSQGGVRIPFDKATLDTIDLIWPQEALVLAPDAANSIGRYWAMLDEQTIVCSPTPDQAYQAEVSGLFQPTPISPDNTTTYLSITYPELLTAAVMIWMAGALARNFGSQADDPKMAQSWESQYETLKDAAVSEELRRRGITPDFVAPKG